jgi:hypothetical protein
MAPAPSEQRAALAAGEHAGASVASEHARQDTTPGSELAAGRRRGRLGEPPPALHRLELRGGGKEFSSEPLYANSNVTLPTILPTGVYMVSAADIPGAKPTKLVVGPFRSSSENDLLLP